MRHEDHKQHGEQVLPPGGSSYCYHESYTSVASPPFVNMTMYVLENTSVSMYTILIHLSYNCNHPVILACYGGHGGEEHAMLCSPRETSRDANVSRH